MLSTIADGSHVHRERLYGRERHLLYYANFLVYSINAHPRIVECFQVANDSTADFSRQFLSPKKFQKLSTEVSDGAIVQCYPMLWLAFFHKNKPLHLGESVTQRAVGCGGVRVTTVEGLMDGGADPSWESPWKKAYEILR